MTEWLPAESIDVSLARSRPREETARWEFAPWPLDRGPNFLCQYLDKVSSSGHVPGAGRGANGQGDDDETREHNERLVSRTI